VTLSDAHAMGGRIRVPLADVLRNPHLELTRWTTRASPASSPIRNHCGHRGQNVHWLPEKLVCVCYIIPKITTHCDCAPSCCVNAHAWPRATWRPSMSQLRHKPQTMQTLPLGTRLSFFCAKPDSENRCGPVVPLLHLCLTLCSVFSVNPCITFCHRIRIPSEKLAGGDHQYRLSKEERWVEAVACEAYGRHG